MAKEVSTCGVFLSVASASSSPSSHRPSVLLFLEVSCSNDWCCSCLFVCLSAVLVLSSVCYDFVCFPFTVIELLLV